MKRTGKQNNSLHKWCEQIAEALNEEGHTVQDVIKRMNRMELWHTKYTVKEMLVKSLIQHYYGKESTTELETNEFQKVEDTIHKFLGREFQIHVPFPHEEITDS